MCGRYTIRKPRKTFEEHFGIERLALVVGGSMHDYRGIITGVAQRYQRTEAGTSR